MCVCLSCKLHFLSCLPSTELKQEFIWSGLCEIRPLHHYEVPGIICTTGIKRQANWKINSTSKHFFRSYASYLNKKASVATVDYIVSVYLRRNLMKCGRKGVWKSDFQSLVRQKELMEWYPIRVHRFLG